MLKAQPVGLSAALVPAGMVLVNVVYATAAYPAGVVSDRMNHSVLLIIGLGVLIMADLVLAYAGTIAGVSVGVVLWDLHMGLTQGLLVRLVADTAPAELCSRGFQARRLEDGLPEWQAAGLPVEAIGTE